jgi:hypothetical protein
MKYTKSVQFNDIYVIITIIIKLSLLFFCHFSYNFMIRKILFVKKIAGHL